MFDVAIEEQTSDEDVAKLSSEIEKAVNKINGVNYCEQVDDELDTVEDKEPEEEETDEE